MAAEAAVAAGASVDLYEGKASVGHKFLIAGRGGLNLTHSDPLPLFAARFGERTPDIARWLDEFGPERLRDWARGLGIETFVGSSGRVFPLDQKAAPLLRAWVKRVREQAWSDAFVFFKHEDGGEGPRLAARFLGLAC